jgi:hypothetical protein
MTTYVLTISNHFPTTHKRKGEPTNFYMFILRKLKKHTIRGNYELWKKRFDKINAGEACLSIRHWNGKPYNSTQSELLKLTKEDGIGIEKLTFKEMVITTQEVMSTHSKVGLHIWKPNVSNIATLANNDGLEVEDFKDWFKKYDLSKEMAIIHFTDFRYCH